MAVEGHISTGDTIAGYEIEELVGRGGMGEIYRARDPRLERRVALKLLAARYSEDEAFRERLLRESRIAASLDHPNVIPVYEAGETDDRLFIAMRFVEDDVQDLLRREAPLEPARAIAIAAQIASALDAAHAGGLVHRDVKPSNVLLDLNDGREHVYLADFGLTQSASDRCPTDGQLMGTVDYVAPEQIRGDDVDGRADVYALGCLVFEALTGRVPFTGASDVAVVYAHLESERPRASESNRALPAALDPILARAMAKDREARQPTCSALVEEAREALGITSRSQSGAWRVVAGVGVVVAALLAVAVGALALRGGDATPSVRTGSLVRVDPAKRTVVTDVPIPGDPGNLVVTPGGVWIADFVGGVLWRYEPESGGLQRITSNGEPRDLAALGDDVYVGADGEFLSGIVSRFDAVTGVRKDSVKLLACAMGSGQGVVWAAGCPLVERLSVQGGRLRVAATRFIPFAVPSTSENSRAQMRELAVGGGSLWVLGDSLDRRVWRLDRHSGRILATIALEFPPRSAAFGGGRLWVSDSLNDAVVPIDATTNRVLAPIPVGRSPGGVAYGAEAVWVPNMLDGTLTRIDARSGARTDTIEVGGFPREVTFGDGAVWVTAYED